MTHGISSSKRWNIFARELETILLEHGLSFNNLTSGAGIHSERVRRLKHSLTTPRFHLLSPEELDRVIHTFNFTGEEQLRLRAAILATAIEETLMNRIDADNALKAAEEIFPILVKALHKRVGLHQGIAATRKGTMTDETADADILESALERFDQAMIALHLSYNVSASRERSEQASKACNGFVAALEALEELCQADSMINTSKTWQIWHTEIRSNLAIAQQRLEQLQQ